MIGHLTKITELNLKILGVHVNMKSHTYRMLKFGISTSSLFPFPIKDCNPGLDPHLFELLGTIPYGDSKKPVTLTVKHETQTKKSGPKR